MTVLTWRVVPTVVVSMILGAAAGCANEAAHRTPPNTMPSAAVSDSATPVVDASSTSPAPAPCSDDPPPTNTATSTGSAVEATVLKQSGPSSQWNIALPDATADRVPELGRTELPDDFDTAFNRAYDEAGAFTYGGMVLQLHLANPTGKKITVFDLRPVNMRMVCMPTGLLVVYGSEGGDFIGMTMNLEASRPVAHERSPDDGNVSTEPYFGSHTIALAPGESQDVDLDITVAKRAYTFDLALGYVTDGGKHTQLIRRGGQPFRATASMCPSTANRATLSASDAQRLRGQHFDKILARTGALDENGKFTVSRATTEEYLRKCDTW